MDDETNDNLIVIGRVNRPHGIRGRLLIDDMTGGVVVPAVGDKIIFQFEDESRTLEIAKVKDSNKGYILGIDGFARREEVEEFRSIFIAIPQEQMPQIDDDDEFYYYELIGLAVYGKDGSRIGEVAEVSEIGGDVIIVKTEKGGRLMVPFAREHIVEIVAGEKIVIEQFYWDEPDAE